MTEKRTKLETDRINALKSERNEIQEFRNRIVNDNATVAHDKLQKKLEFMQANGRLIEEKTEKHQKHEEEKYKERMNFFPFTHGEMLETQRKDINENMKIEIQQEFAKKMRA